MPVYQPLEIEYWSKPDQIGHPQRLIRGLGFPKHQTWLALDEAAPDRVRPSQRSRLFSEEHAEVWSRGGLWEQLRSRQAQGHARDLRVRSGGGTISSTVAVLNMKIGRNRSTHA